MTVDEIIAEVERLSREDKRKIFELIRQMPETGILSPEELGELTKRMVETPDEAEAERLKEELIRGFYGDESRA